MPKVPGEELVRAVRARRELAQAIICVLSTSMSEAKEKELKNLGATFVFKKPVHYPDYKTILEKLFSRKSEIAGNDGL
ncbi:MAG TPA: hypothetical protein VGK59_18695 [Ohtaekwangia sp.]